MIEPRLLSAEFALHSVFGRDGALRIERELRGLGAHQLNAGVGEHVDLAVVIGDDANVHQFGELADIAVALIEQLGGRAVGLSAAQKLHVDVGDLLHRVVGDVDRAGQAGLGIGAQRLNAARHAC